MNPRRLTAYLLFLITTIIAAVAGIVIKLTLNGISTLPFLTYRFGISAIIAIFTIFVVKHKGFPKNINTWVELIIYSFASSTFALGVLFLGLSKTTVLDMSLITSIAPILIAICGNIFLREHVTKREKIGMAIAFLGTLAILVEPIIRLHDGKSQVIGNILIFIYVIIISLAAVSGKRLLRQKVSPLAITNFTFIVGFLTILPITILSLGLSSFKDIVINLPINFQLGVIFMAVISGNMAYFLGNFAQKSIEIGESALFTYLIPVFTAPLAIWFLNEKISGIFVVGSIITLIGVAIAEWKGRLYN